MKDGLKLRKFALKYEMKIIALLFNESTGRGNLHFLQFSIDYFLYIVMFAL